MNISNRLSSFALGSVDLSSDEVESCSPRRGFSQKLILAALLIGATLPIKAGTCTINVTSNQQTIDGFGFASVWASALTSGQANVFFGTGSGQLGFSLLRVRIAPDQNWATETSNASLAHSLGAKVLGTAWTPPASMKSNNNVVGGSLNTSQYGAYASYLANAASSMNLDYVSFQNEPDITVTYESCSWTPAQMETWVLNNAPTVGKPIVMPESFHFDDAYSDPTLNNSTAASHVTYIAGHIYGGGNTVHQNAINHGKHVWMTEHYNDNQTIAAAITDAKEISDCMNNQMSAYIWWRAYHDTLASDDLINGTTPLKNGYAIGQFAKYVRPGKARCSSTYSPTTNVYVTAYHNNGLVIVAINTGTSSVSQAFSLQNVSGVTSLLVNRTSASENMAGVSNATVSSNSFSYTLPAQSVTTFHQF
jgi:glucuronoarabinoxylan endo-1,4-beta-xylanase